MKGTAPKKPPKSPPANESGTGEGGLSVPNTLKSFTFFEERGNGFPFTIGNLELGFRLHSFYLIYKK
jgi:hypothetical protein